jgi:hypothetical protein
MTNMQKAPKLEGLIDKIRGLNWRNWKFNDQLRVKLHKSKTKDYTVKGAQTWGSNWSFGRGSIAQNQRFMVNKGFNWNNLKECELNWKSVKTPLLTQNGAVSALRKKRTRRRVVWSLFIVFPDFCPKMTAQGATFKVHLMPHTSTKIDNSCTKMITWTPSMTVYYPFIPIDMKNALVTGLK